MTTIHIDQKKPFYHDYRVKYGVIAVLLVGMCLLYAVEFQWFDLMLDLQKLVLRSLFIGGAIGIGLGYYYQKYATDLTENIQIYVFFVVLSLFFSPLLGSMTNRLLAFGNEQTQITTIYYIEAQYANSYGLLEGEIATANQWRLELETSEGLFSIKTKNDAVKEAQKGDQLLIKTKRGLLGVAFIDLNSLQLVR